MRALYSPQIYRIFSIRFSSRVRTKQNQHGPYFVPVYDQVNTFFLGAGGGVGARRMPHICTQPCIRLSRVLGMLTSELGNVTETVT